MMILRLAINAVALYAAIALVPGLQAENPNWVAYIWMALIFGLVNALVRPILKLLTCPLILLTLGLFTLVINTVMLYITSYVGEFFGVGLSISDFWAAFLGALVISVISVVLTSVVRDTERPRSHAKTPK
ncbi:MAG: phage holin family protein [Chloroflexi bacterium]|nr:phage holin family protein [Chloroflexota bacterium]MQC26370.1 phage holin family protein [Chloroflexota bacterium]